MTTRTVRSLEWRYGARSGLLYEYACLREAAEPTAMVYRVASKRGTRLLVVCELVGEGAARRELVHSVARRTRARAVLAAQGPGAYDNRRRWPLRRGRSLVAVRTLRAIHPDPRRRDSWAFTLGDLEQTL